MKSIKTVLSITLALSLAQNPAWAQFEPSVELSDLNSLNGFTLNGIDNGDRSGISVSSAGDFNDDGIDDIIIGAYAAGVENSGSSYVVFGSDGQLPNPINLSTLNGSNGFTINGVTDGDASGFSVSAAGDINGDGKDDIIIGSTLVDIASDNNVGASYVLFGTSTPLPNPFNLSDINGLNGFVINGISAGDLLGYSVSQAGDVNGDGVDDLIAAARGVNFSTGSSYVIFGSIDPLPNPLNVENLDGSNGFSIMGADDGGASNSISVSGAGDINNDGFDDVIIGASLAENGQGAAYVVLGFDDDLISTIDLINLNAINGFTINGADFNDHLGFSVGAAGDMNGDGIDDLIVGAKYRTANGLSEAGSSFVVFGSNNPMPNPFNINNINGINGYTINGVAQDDNSGSSVSSAGDVNGDGFSDLIIGAPAASPNGKSNAGSSYVLFGTGSRPPNPFNLSSLDGTNGFVINGVSLSDRAGNSVSSAGDINGDGIDDLIIGASYADPNGIEKAGSSYVVFGNDVIFKDAFE